MMLHSVYTQLASLLKTELDITPSVFQEIYLRTPGANHRPEAEEVVELLVNAGIGVGNTAVVPFPRFFGRRRRRQLINFTCGWNKTPQQLVSNASRTPEKLWISIGWCTDPCGQDNGFATL